MGDTLSPFLSVPALGRLTGNDGLLHLCARGDQGRFVHRSVLVQLRYPANLRRGTQRAMVNPRLPLAGSDQLLKEGRFGYLHQIRRINA